MWAQIYNNFKFEIMSTTCKNEISENGERIDNLLKFDNIDTDNVCRLR